MDLADTITAVAIELGRPLKTDEFVMLGKLREAGRTPKQIADVIGERPPDVSDEELVTTRAEVVNRQVREID